MNTSVCSFALRVCKSEPLLRGNRIAAFSLLNHLEHVFSQRLLVLAFGGVSKRVLFSDASNGSVSDFWIFNLFCLLKGCRHCRGLAHDLIAESLRFPSD